LNGLISSSTKEEEEQEQTFASLGKVVEDPNGILEQINNMYCDASGRPYVDVRIIRALILHDPYEDPADLNEVLKHRGVHLAPPLPSEEEGEGAPWVSMASPEWTKPEEEVVLARMDAHAVLEDDDGDDNGKKEEEREEEYKKKEDKSRAVVLEMLGDLPSAGTLCLYFLFLYTNSCLDMLFSLFWKKGVVAIAYLVISLSTVIYLFMQYVQVHIIAYSVSW